MKIKRTKKLKTFPFRHVVGNLSEKKIFNGSLVAEKNIAHGGQGEEAL